MVQRDYSVPLADIPNRLHTLEDVPMVVAECLTHAFSVDEYFLSGSFVWREYCGFTGNVRDLKITGRTLEGYLGAVVMMEDFAWNVAALCRDISLEQVSVADAVDGHAEFVFAQNNRTLHVTLQTDEGVHLSNIWVHPTLGALRVVRTYSVMAELLAAILKCDICPAEMACFCSLLDSVEHGMPFKLSLVRRPLIDEIGIEMFQGFKGASLMMRFHSQSPQFIQFLLSLLVPVSGTDKYISIWNGGVGEGIEQFL